MFPVQKYKEYLNGSNLIVKLEAKHDLLKQTLGEGEIKKQQSDPTDSTSEDTLGGGGVQCQYIFLLYTNGFVGLARDGPRRTSPPRAAEFVFGFQIVTPSIVSLYLGGSSSYRAHPFQRSLLCSLMT